MVKKMIVYHGATSDDVHSEIRSGTFVSEEDDYIAKSYADNMGECGLIVNPKIVKGFHSSEG